MSIVEASKLIQEPYEQQLSNPGWSNTAEWGGSFPQEAPARRGYLAGAAWETNDAKAAQMFAILAAQKAPGNINVLKIQFSMATWSVQVKAAGMFKRALDLLISILVLPFLAPVIILTAIAVKLDSPGPVLFRQPRVGKYGKPFTCYKFRSMVIDAEEKKAGLAHLNEADAIVFKIANDPRITRSGRIIRKLSIDEIPQIFNVIKGEMSWVGPRPPLPSEVENYNYDVRRRLLATPGITGLQQVSGRSSVAFSRWIELDLQYIQEQSLKKDIEILFKTIPAVLLGKDAY